MQRKKLLTFADRFFLFFLNARTSEFKSDEWHSIIQSFRQHMIGADEQTLQNAIDELSSGQCDFAPEFAKSWPRDKWERWFKIWHTYAQDESLWLAWCTTDDMLRAPDVIADACGFKRSSN